MENASATIVVVKHGDPQGYSRQWIRKVTTVILWFYYGVELLTSTPVDTGQHLKFLQTQRCWTRVWLASMRLSLDSELSSLPERLSQILEFAK